MGKLIKICFVVLILGLSFSSQAYAGKDKDITIRETPFTEMLNAIDPIVKVLRGDVEKPLVYGESFKFYESNPLWLKNQHISISSGDTAKKNSLTEGKENDIISLLKKASEHSAIKTISMENDEKSLLIDVKKYIRVTVTDLINVLQQKPIFNLNDKSKNHLFKSVAGKLEKVKKAIQKMDNFYTKTQDVLKNLEINSLFDKDDNPVFKITYNGVTLQFDEKPWDLQKYGKNGAQAKEKAGKCIKSQGETSQKNNAMELMDAKDFFKVLTNTLSLNDGFAYVFEFIAFESLKSFSPSENRYQKLVKELLEKQRITNKDEIAVVMAALSHSLQFSFYRSKKVDYGRKKMLVYLPSESEKCGTFKYKSVDKVDDNSEVHSTSSEIFTQ